jgi:hypothetical protein
MPAGLVVKVNNFGFLFTFTVQNADGSARDLTGLTVTLYVYTQDQTPTLLFSGVCAVQAPATAGICTYMVVSGNFPNIGTYNAELELTQSTSYLEDTETFTIDVIPNHAYQPT